MSRMKSLAVAALGAGLGMAAAASSALTNAVAAGAELISGEPRAARRRQARRGHQLVIGRRGSRSRYQPHQGIQEQYRRRGQIMAGKLAFYSSGVEPAPAEPTPVKASTLIENGLEAERRAKRSEAARKAAATRAARKREAANG